MSKMDDMLNAVNAYLHGDKLAKSHEDKIKAGAESQTYIIEGLLKHNYVASSRFIDELQLQERLAQYRCDIEKKDKEDKEAELRNATLIETKMAANKATTTSGLIDQVSAMLGKKDNSSRWAYNPIALTNQTEADKIHQAYLHLSNGKPESVQVTFTDLYPKPDTCSVSFQGHAKIDPFYESIKARLGTSKFFDRANKFVETQDKSIYDFSVVMRVIESVISNEQSPNERSALSNGWEYVPIEFDTEKLFSDKEKQHGIIHGDGLVLMRRNRAIGISNEANRLIIQEANNIYPQHVQDMRDNYERQIRQLKHEVRCNKKLIARYDGIINDMKELITIWYDLFISKLTTPEAFRDVMLGIIAKREEKEDE